MFIDDLGVMLLDLVAGLTLLALCVRASPDAANQPRWATGFAMVGFLALITSLPMVLTWPLPSSYNIAFGDALLWFSIAFLGAAWALAKGQGLGIPSLLSLPGAVAAIVVGIRIVGLGMTREPLLAGAGYILTGVGGALVPLQVRFAQQRVLRLTVVGLLLAAAAIWALTVYPAYWGHLAAFAKWVPAATLSRLPPKA